MPTQFEPLQPLIDFSVITPRLAWVARGYQFGHVICIDNRWQVAVSHYKDELEQNLFSWTNINKVKPFTPELWAACQEIIMRRVQVEIDYEMLKRGKPTVNVPSRVMAPWQASLLEVSA